MAKYYVTKRAPQFVYEAMEVHGGNGYVEDFPMARHFRQSPLNSIWEVGPQFRDGSRAARGHQGGRCGPQDSSTWEVGPQSRDGSRAARGSQGGQCGVYIRIPRGETASATLLSGNRS